MSEIVATIDDLMHDEGQLALVRYVVGVRHATYESYCVQVRESEQLTASLKRLHEEKVAVIRGCDTGLPDFVSENCLYSYGLC